ncbi:unnamed protein product [Didymodactylos carnosus]|uniref:Sulfotransferase n=1 Tax=Didymodactylos carnosus TaxID=1234261 RepID=A0A8S2HUN5_9BILA|nr:unnamed protein product [Didymodactylos carnosus]CAF3686303.1 unnamed protein product [Didymodactylos carnosus]
MLFVFLSVRDTTLRQFSFTPQRIIYTRVPKCGSTTLLRLFQDQSQIMNFNVAVRGPAWTYQLNTEERKRYIMEINNLQPFTIFIRHIYFVNFGFQQSSSSSLGHISLIRDPIKRIISQYYFVRHRCLHDKICPGKFNKAYINQTLDECLEHSTYKCISMVNGVSNMIGFFCGQSLFCNDLNSVKPLKKAKLNIIQYYTMVGMLEQLDQFLYVLNHQMPRYFDNIHHLYKARKSPRKNKSAKPPHLPNNHTIKKLKILLKNEYELYEFVYKRFNEQYTKLIKTYSTNSNMTR